MTRAALITAILITLALLAVGDVATVIAAGAISP